MRSVNKLYIKYKHNIDNKIKYKIKVIQNKMYIKYNKNININKVYYKLHTVYI